jgi:nitronate monooxygenase
MIGSVDNRSVLPSPLPLAVAPMAGGPSTPELVAAVAGAGGFGFLAGGYLTAAALDERRRALERLSDAAYGVNLFLPSTEAADPVAIEEYAGRLAPEAARLGVELGRPRRDDDDLAAKVELLAQRPPALVSFTFGVPERALRDRLDCPVAVTVTSAADAVAALAAGPDALVVQGAEAGGHRSVFSDVAPDPLLPLLDALAAVRAVTALPLVAAGGIGTAADVRRALEAGATAVAAGTAFLCCPEAGTSAPHRRALLESAYDETVVTRAFTGRSARALRNRFAREHTGAAPAGYPEVHHLTRPLRVAAAQRGDLEVLHLWAGTGWRAARAEPAAVVVARLTGDR